VKVNEIEPRFEAIESRLIAIEADQHTHAGEPPDPGVPPSHKQRNSTAGEASEDATFPTAQKADIPTGLKADIQADLKVYDANTVGQALLHKVCIRNGNRNFCRSEEMEIETGDIKRVQPFKLTDAKFNVLTREMLDRVLAETESTKSNGAPKRWTARRSHGSSVRFSRI